MISRFALVVSLALAVAACGSSNQPSGESTAAAAAPSATPEATPSETPAAAASAAPTPAPTSKAETEADEHKGDKDNESEEQSAGPPQAFNQCAACHSTAPGKTIIGPSLAGVYGSKAGQVPGFQFSDAMKNSGLVWTSANLDKFLADPKSVVPGTLMSFAGLKDESQRKAVIDYLKTLK